MTVFIFTSENTVLVSFHCVKISFLLFFFSTIVISIINDNTAQMLLDKFNACIGHGSLKIHQPLKRIGYS